MLQLIPPSLLSVSRILFGNKLRVTSKGKRFIKTFEDIRLVAYQDQGGVWTIGWGTTKDVKPGMKIDRVTAEEWFERDLYKFEKAVNDLIRVPLEWYQFDALVSFTYNVGVEALRASTLRRLLNNRNYIGAAEQFSSWVYIKKKVSNGLVRRRALESKYFLGEV